MKVPSPQPETSVRRPQKTLRKGLFWTLTACLAAFLVVVLVLATPSGQRWAVHRALKAATAALGDESSPVGVELDAVEFAWSPLGISLNGLSLQKNDDVGSPIALASLSELVLLPADQSGQHWLTVSVHGLDVSAEGAQWLTTLPSSDTSGKAAPSISIAEMDLSGVRIALPDSMLSSPWTHEVVLEQARLQEFSWENGRPDWQVATGEVQILSRTQDAAPEDTTFLAWEALDHLVQIKLSANPAFWLAETSVSSAATAACPGEWTGGLSRRDSTLELSGTADWGTVQILAGLDSAGVRLDLAQLSYSSLPWALPEVVPSAGRMELNGPLVLPMSAGGDADRWREVKGLASLNYLHTTATGTPCEVAVEWDLESGEMASDGDWHTSNPDSDTDAAFGWSTQGTFVPLADLDLSSTSNKAVLGGTWNASRSGQGFGSLEVDGTMDLSATPDGKSGIDVHWDLTARTAPLVLTEGLELYGGWGSSGEVNVNGSGRIDDWWGHVDLTGARFIPLPGFDGRQRQGAPLSMKRFQMQGRGGQQGFEVDLTGDFIEGHIDGPYSMGDWKSPMIEALVSGEVITKATAKRWGSTETGSSTVPPDWTANLTVWRDDLLERYSHDQWSIGSGSHVEVQHRGGEVSVSLDLKPLHWGPLKAHNLEVEGRGGENPMAWQIHADSLHHSTWGLAQNLTLAAEVGITSGSQFTASWDGTVPVSIALEHHLKDDNIHVVVPSKVDLSFADATWKLASHSAPRLQWKDADWTSLWADDIKLSGSQGLLSVQSSGAAPADIAVQLDRLPVAPWLSMLAPPLGMALPEGDGMLHAAFDVKTAPLSVTGAAQWEDAQVEGFDFGDLCLTGSWSDDPHIELQQFLDDTEVLRATMDDAQAIEVGLVNWPLQQLRPLFKGAGITLTGNATGDVSLGIQENGAPPSTQGTVAIDAEEVFIPATGMTYGLRGNLDFGEGLIGMDMGTITDPKGQFALLNISVLHDAFTDWNYDLGLELPEDFLVMDLAPDRSRLFYGKVAATGDANLFGTSDGLSILVDARSAAGTQFTMPLDALDGPGIPSGIHFTGGSKTALPTKPPPPFDLSMEIEVEITPEAELSLVLDQQAGERVDGRAQGALSLVRNRNQSLSMEGGLEIMEGQYRFSLRDLFTKTIQVAPGGTIDWDGNPYEAQLDLLAVASMRASPAPLLPGLLSPMGKTEVEVGMGIAGELAGPPLEFSIAFPTYAKAEPELLAQVQPALSTPEETQRQAFALLAAGQFIPSDQINTNALGRATAAAQATDLVSTGVSELLSSLSEDVDIGLRYLPSASGSVIDPSTALTEDAFEMDLGLNLLNDRLKISGTLGARSPDGLQIDPADFTGAIDLRYQLTPDGRWELMGYSKPESDLANDDNYRYGLGAVYQVRFDHLRDLFRKSEAP